MPHSAGKHHLARHGAAFLVESSVRSLLPPSPLPPLRPRLASLRPGLNVSKVRRGDTPHILQVFILRSFKSNDFVCANSKGLTDAFFVCADSKGVASVDLAQNLTMYGSVAFAKRLAGLQFTPPRR